MFDDLRVFFEADGNKPPRLVFVFGALFLNGHQSCPVLAASKDKRVQSLLSPVVQLGHSDSSRTVNGNVGNPLSRLRVPKTFLVFKRDGTRKSYSRSFLNQQDIDRAKTSFSEMELKRRESRSSFPFFQAGNR